MTLLQKVIATYFLFLGLLAIGTHGYLLVRREGSPWMRLFGIACGAFFVWLTLAAFGAE